MHHHSKTILTKKCDCLQCVCVAVCLTYRPCWWVAPDRLHCGTQADTCQQVIASSVTVQGDTEVPVDLHVGAEVSFHFSWLTCHICPYCNLHFCGLLVCPLSTGACKQSLYFFCWGPVGVRCPFCSLWPVFGGTLMYCSSLWDSLFAFWLDCLLIIHSIISFYDSFPLLLFKWKADMVQSKI